MIRRRSVILEAELGTAKAQWLAQPSPRPRPFEDALRTTLLDLAGDRAVVILGREPDNLVWWGVRAAGDRLAAGTRTFSLRFGLRSEGDAQARD